MVKQAIRPAIFTWRQTEPELIQGPAVGLTSDGAGAPRDRRASRDHRPLMARLEPS